ncbi:MAG TPA: IclR family transcriptional regulator [Clostridia bacterium]|nr:IclR family transcriptional regulator [Clostridia bacterium]
MTKTNQPFKTVAVLEKALNIIEYLSKYPYGLPLSRIARDVGINKSTVFQILNTLRIHGYVAQNTTTNDYRLDYKFLTFSQIFNDLDVKTIARPFIQKLTDKTGLSVNLAILDSNTSLNIDRTDASRLNSIRIETIVGFRTALYCCATGKAMLSGFSDEELNSYIENTNFVPRTKHTITDQAELRSQIEKIRETGYSIEDMENEDNIVSIAAPLKNASCKVYAAISFISIKALMTDEVIKELGEQLIECARDISKELGCFNY